MEDNDEEQSNEGYKIPLKKRQVQTESSEPTIKDLCDRINKRKMMFKQNFKRKYVMGKNELN